MPNTSFDYYDSENLLNFRRNFGMNDSLLIDTTNSSRPLNMSLSHKILWISSFFLMIVVAIIGNLMVLWTVLAHKPMRTVTNYFLLNLSIADFLMATLNATFNSLFMIEGHWFFGSQYCSANNFTANLTVASSVFTLMAMCIDRYIAIMYPLRPRISKFSVLIIIATIWGFSAILSIPNLIFSKTRTWYYFDGTYRTICYIVWPDGPTAISHTDFKYNIVFLFITYVIPILLMITAYTKMGICLWGSKGIGESASAQLGNIKAKRKIVKMFIVVMTLFGICWLPYHTYFIYVHFNKDILKKYPTQHIYLTFYLLAMSNTLYNPIIYYFMNRRFRHYFTIIMKFNGYIRKFSSNPNLSRKGTEKANFTLSFNERKSKKNKSNLYSFSCPKPDEKVQTCERNTPRAYEGIPMMTIAETDNI